MNEDDKRQTAKARPYLIGIVALALRLRAFTAPVKKPVDYFDEAEDFVQEFMDRNGIEAVDEE